MTDFVMNFLLGAPNISVWAKNLGICQLNYEEQNAMVFSPWLGHLGHR